MNSTYKIVDVNGKQHSLGKPNPSAAFRAAKEWAQIMKVDMIIVNEQTGEIGSKISAKTLQRI